MEPLNLPQYTTPLVGRKTEIADVGYRLRDPDCRILTLVGSGGIGKTRLAIEAAAQQASIFQDGIIFVALQPVAQVDSIVRTMGSAIGFEFSTGSKPERQLQQYLHKKENLLILDNVEHLLGIADIIADLVATTIQLKLLITSREPLKLQDEWLYHVKGLPFPKQESAKRIETYDAVRLFAEHAGRVQRDFSLDEEQAPIIRICQLVQGMPLGIELAAKWRRRLPSVEIARELQKSLDILQTDLRDVPDRHRSMRAVFDQSWKLLTDDERRVFMSLSVFRGGFRRDAAEQVAGASMAVLMSLVDKSLLRVNRNGRYDIHELQRQYAAERLSESPKLEAAVRDQHSDYYTAFIDRPVNDFLNADNQETLKVLDGETDNFRTAWEWAIARQNVNYLNQALDGLYWYAWKRSWHEEGERAFRQAVAVLRAVEPSDKNLIILGRALTLQAAMDIWLGRAAQAAGRAREAETILRPLDSQPDLAGAVGIQGWAALAQQQWAAAKTLLEESVALYDDPSHNEVKAFALGQLGHIARIQGDYAAGEYWYQEALNLGRQIGDQRTIAESQVHLGILAQWRGHYFQARQLYQAGLEVARAADFAPIVVGALHDLSAVAIILGELDVARGHIEESLSIATEDGKGPGIAWSLIHLAEVLIAQGDLAAAQEQYQAALEIPPGTADRGRYAAVRAGRGRIAWQSGEYAVARRHYKASVAFYREVHDRAGIASNLVSLARIALARGNKSQSSAYLSEALQNAIEDGAPLLLLDVMVGIAGLFTEEGNLVDAVRLAALLAQHPASSAECRRFAEAILNSTKVSLMAARRDTGSGWENPDDLIKLGEQLARQLALPPAQPLVEGLSERELEILRLVGEGKSNREIAQELVLAVGTVKSHLHNILQKLDASNRTQAVARARELHLL